MNQVDIQPKSNISGCVLFIITGAEKRRAIAKRKAKMVQGTQGIVPKLVAVK